MMSMEYNMVIQITSIEHLMKVADTKDGQLDRLDFRFYNKDGFAYTSKNILYEPINDSWEIFDFGSDAWEEWESTYDFVNCEFIGGSIYKAIKKGEFYVERI